MFSANGLVRVSSAVGRLPNHGLFVRQVSCRLHNVINNGLAPCSARPTLLPGVFGHGLMCFIHNAVLANIRVHLYKTWRYLNDSIDKPTYKKSQRLTGYVRRPANVTVAPREGVLLSSCLCFHYVGVSVGDTVKSCIAKPVDATWYGTNKHSRIKPCFAISSSV